MGRQHARARSHLKLVGMDYDRSYTLLLSQMIFFFLQLIIFFVKEPGHLHCGDSGLDKSRKKLILYQLGRGVVLLVLAGRWGRYKLSQGRNEASLKHAPDAWVEGGLQILVLLATKAPGRYRPMYVPPARVARALLGYGLIDVCCECWCSTWQQHTPLAVLLVFHHANPHMHINTRVRCPQRLLLLGTANAKAAVDSLTPLGTGSAKRCMLKLGL